MFLGMVFLRILWTRSTYNFFDDETGLLYSHDSNTNKHKCVHASFMKFFNFPPKEWKAIQCVAVYKNRDDHCHPPLERHYIERMLLLWQSYLDALAYPRFLNGSCAFWTACREWKWLLDFDLESFHNHHKNALSNMVKEARNRSHKSVRFINNLGPYYYRLLEELVFGRETAYWEAGITPRVPDAHCKYDFYGILSASH